MIFIPVVISFHVPAKPAVALQDDPASAARKSEKKVAASRKSMAVLRPASAEGTPTDAAAPPAGEAEAPPQATAGQV